MKINKFKSLLVAVCSFIATSLWSESQCMEQIRNDESDRHINNYQTEISAGSIVSFAGEVAPYGWLLCDGSQYYSREYPNLYEVIKTKYVPANEQLNFIQFNEINDNKKFRVPDLRGRVIVGVDGDKGCITSNNTLGASGGEEKHQLTVDEIPSHNHNYDYLVNTNNYLVPQGEFYGIVYDPLSRSTSSVGRDQPHNNMQPYLVLNYIINTGVCAQELRDLLTNLRGEIDKLKSACAKARIVFDGL
jgi:microcystin-dependent protein